MVGFWHVCPSLFWKAKASGGGFVEKKLISITGFTFLFKLCDQSWGYTLFLFFKFYHHLFVVCLCVMDGDSKQDRVQKLIKVVSMTACSRVQGYDHELCAATPTTSYQRHLSPHGFLSLPPLSSTLVLLPVAPLHLYSWIHHVSDSMQHGFNVLSIRSALGLLQRNGIVLPSSPTW